MSFFIERPVATTLIAIGIVVLGCLAYVRLPVAALPTVDLPTIVVRATLPGASPETMASTVATPLERQLGTIAGLTELTSVNAQGSSTIVAQFSLDRDVDGAAQDVQAAISAAEADLPTEMPQAPIYIKANPNVYPVLILALTSDTMSVSDIYDHAETVLRQRLSRIDGVGRVELSGSAKPAVRVNLDPAQMAARGLSAEDVRKALVAATVNQPLGRLDTAGQSFIISADTQVMGAEAYRHLIIAERDGAPVRLSDIADVADSVTDSRQASWWKDKPAVLVEILKRPGANITATVADIRQALQQTQRWLPASIDVHIASDQTRFIEAGLAEMQTTLLLTAALVIGVVGIFLRRFWATAIPTLTIPVTLGGTLALMYPAGFGLDNLSIMALIVAVSFIVDDTIVMIENIVRLIDEGKTPLEAAHQGLSEMMFTIVSLTAALLSALIPVLFMPDVVGRFFQEFGATLAFAIVLSAIVSMTMTPMLCARFLPASPPQEKAPGLFERSLGLLTRAYGRSLSLALQRPRLTLLTLLLLLIGSLFMFSAIPKGLLPTQDTGVIRGITAAPADVSFEAMRQRQQAVAKVILADPDVNALTSSVGIGLLNALNTGTLRIDLKPLGERKVPTSTVIDRLRPKLQAVGGMETFLSQVDTVAVGGRVGRGRYQYTLQGADFSKLLHWAEVMRARLDTMPQLVNIGSDQDDSGLTAMLGIDRSSAARLGVSVSAIDQTLYDAFGQRQITTLYTASNQYKLVLGLDPQKGQTPEVFRDLYVPGSDGVPVRLSSVTETRPGTSPVQVSHQSQVPAITLSFDTKAGVSIEQAMDLIEASARDAQLPPDIRGVFAGSAKTSQESIAKQSWLLLGAILAIYGLLGVLYESFAHPLTILSTIPSAAIGAIATLLVTGTEFSFVAVIGMMLLIGIVMKNAILMVDVALTAMREQGVSAREAMEEAAVLRFRPILMTTLAAILGAVPLAIGGRIGSELYEPLGLSIVGGLLVSQLVTIYTTPTVFLAIDSLSRRLRGRRQVLAAAES
ncbi:efflux RND transporter permease subunit [Rhizobium paknamense]|uniref:Multidrug efflux pump n=1 Tax=Rhizobium paknamense TaxID=1206817 RepID=A0ABU0IHL5_9HYPH|nr:efflux RND transporter permease subunit [Rhizobium paknamense]MDQ0457756.1 multidrug efflux pump [Rhizobium paknamense]